MLDITPYPVSFFQEILDKLVYSVGQIRTPVVWGKALPLLIMFSLVGLIVFGFLGLPFRAFAFIKEKTFEKTDESLDGFLGKKTTAKNYEKMIKSGKLKYTNEKTRKEDIGKVVADM